MRETTTPTAGRSETRRGTRWCRRHPIRTIRRDTTASPVPSCTPLRTSSAREKVDFSLIKITAGQPDVTRDYERFTDVINDTINARIWLGIHFRTPDVQGAGLGEDVADWLDRRFFDKR